MNEGNERKRNLMPSVSDGKRKRKFIFLYFPSLVCHSCQHFPYNEYKNTRVFPFKKRKATHTKNEKMNFHTFIPFISTD